MPATPLTLRLVVVRVDAVQEVNSESTEELVPIYCVLNDDVLKVRCIVLWVRPAMTNPSWRTLSTEVLPVVELACQ